MTEWYWCLTHGRAELTDERDDIENSLGPYPSAEAAANWKATNEARNEEWDAADEAWNGDDGDTDD